MGKSRDAIKMTPLTDAEKKERRRVCNHRYYEANREKIKRDSKAWAKKNYKKAYDSKKKWREENPKTAAASARRSHRFYCDNISGSYLKRTLKRSCLEDATPDMVELKRQQLKLFRLIKQIKGRIQNVSNRNQRTQANGKTV
jgi:hypothetical protein